jgi:anti-sigma regulatory factor (Ser/Thr protein kinase)
VNRFQAMARATRLYERLPARPQSIAPLRHAVVDLARANGASDGELEDIAIAVSEAVTNVVLHAYTGHDAPGALTVQAWMDGRRLHVAVCDEGVGMLSPADNPGLGFGLSVIHRIAARVDVEDAHPGVRLRMIFTIA